MNEMRTMLPVDTAGEIVLEHVTVTGTERVALTESLGRVLAEAVVSRRDHPPWDNSALDGYAVRWQDIERAGTDRPACLRVVDEVAAGGLPSRDLGSGEATAIMTGAPLPGGADTVVRAEDTELREDQVLVFKPPARAANIRRRGEDIRAGERVIAAGRRLRPAELGMVATAGHVWVQVYQRPRVTVVATGSELAEPGDSLSPAQIINSNAFSITGLVRETGAEAMMLRSAPDDQAELSARLREACAADVALVIGGVSVGKYDYVKQVLDELGADMKFWRVKMRPGHPVAFGISSAGGGRRPTLLFGLPGNPVACMVAFYQFVRPALRKMMGCETLFLPQVSAELEEDIHQHPGRCHYARAVTTYRDGRYRVRLTDDQGSGILTSMVQANSLLVLSGERAAFTAGEILPVQWLPGEGPVAEH